MANQPPVRPWFRLASLRPLPPAPAPAPALAPAPAPAPARAPDTRSPEPAPARAPEAQPPPAPAPVTRPVVALPTFRTTSAPSSPQTRPTQPPVPSAPAPLAAPAPEPIAPRAERASVPSSPVPKVPSPSPVRKAAISVPPTLASDKTSGTIGAQSPKTIRPAVQAPTESPKVKPTAPPPSPLVLPPPSQPEPPRIPAEAEPKTVVMQKTIEKPKQRTNGNGDEKGKITHHEKSLKEVKKTEDSGAFRVITIAGENKGAFMEVIQSPRKGHKKCISKEGYESGKSTGSGSEEGDAKKNNGKSGRGRSTSSFPMSAFVNSNVQSVNNSLLSNASCSQHDPGVRFGLSKKPLGDGFLVKEQRN